MHFCRNFDTAFGISTEKVVLPCDEESGAVWEYQEGNDAFVDCIKTTTKDGTFDMSFYYRSESGRQYEKIAVTFEMVGKEVIAIEEKRYVWVDVDEDTFRWEEVA